MLINTGNISRKVLPKVLRSFDKNFERLQLMNLFSSEMEKSFATGTFEKRKKEYLQKINCRSEKYKYWTECF